MFHVDRALLESTFSSFFFCVESGAQLAGFGQGGVGREDPKAGCKARFPAGVTIARLSY